MVACLPVFSGIIVIKVLENFPERICKNCKLSKTVDLLVVPKLKILHMIAKFFKVAYRVEISRPVKKSPCDLCLFWNFSYKV